MSAKPSRSQFIEKLHAILENPLDATSLRWIGDDAFEIISNDGLARHALSPSWDFRSLSSFIRQLSYYNFKRLSDRRRSSERRSAASGYIVFSHPSGLFIRGDSTRLGGIIRKTRNRPEKGAGARKASTSKQPLQTQAQEDLQVHHSTLLAQHQAQIHQQQLQQQHQHHQQQQQQHHQGLPVPAWPLDSNRHMPNVLNEYPDDRRLSQHFNTPIPAPYPPNYPLSRPYQPNPEQNSSWRAYTPPWNDAGQRPPPPRRASDFALPINSIPGPPLSPRSKIIDPSIGGPVRKQQQLSISVNGEERYPSPYPTPTFPSYQSYGNPIETGPLDAAPYAPYLPYAGPSHSNGGEIIVGNGVGPSGGHSPDSFHSDPHSDHSPPRQGPPQVNLLHRGSLPTNVLLQHHHQQSQPSQIPFHLQQHISSDSAQLPPFNPQHQQDHSFAGKADRSHLVPSPVRSFSQPEVHLHASHQQHYFNSPPVGPTNGNANRNGNGNGSSPMLQNLVNENGGGAGEGEDYDSFSRDDDEE